MESHAITLTETVEDPTQEQQQPRVKRKIPVIRRKPTVAAFSKVTLKDFHNVKGSTVEKKIASVGVSRPLLEKLLWYFGLAPGVFLQKPFEEILLLFQTKFPSITEDSTLAEIDKLVLRADDFPNVSSKKRVRSPAIEIFYKMKLKELYSFPPDNNIQPTIKSISQQLNISPTPLKTWLQGVG